MQIFCVVLSYTQCASSQVFISILCCFVFYVYFFKQYTGIKQYVKYLPYFISVVYSDKVLY